MHYQSRYCSSFRTQAYPYIIPAAPSDKSLGKEAGTQYTGDDYRKCKGKSICMSWRHME